MPSTNQPLQFGRYTVLGELGRGAMGTVYRAVDPVLEREVAVKTLLPHLPDEVMAEVRERFLREARSAGRLNHPSIVTIYDVGEQDGVAYMAMELLEGRTLQQMLRDPARLPFASIAEIVAQVADALDHAHRFGIVHRDVKPANIVVSPTGRAKLADFGIAHVTSSSMTQTGAALGSPKYMSPEQILGQPVDPRSDVFSLGVVLYEMLTRRTPFEHGGDSTVFALLYRIPAEAHPPAGSLDPGIPPGFDRILARALAKSAPERYQRAGDMAGELRADPSLRRDDDKTVLLAPRSANPAARTPDFERTTIDLIADVEAFENSFEERQQMQLRAEEQAQLRKEEEVRLWGEAEERRREEYERQREADVASRTASQHITAIELLREQAARRKVSDDRARRAAVTARIDARLRVAFKYLSELAAELNRAQPVAGRPYGVMYLGEVAGVILGDGFTDYRSRDMDTRERIDFITFKYKIRCAQPTQVEVSGQQLAQALDRLAALRIPCECVEKKNEFGAVVRATLTLSGPFPCQATLRGDYDGAGFVLDLINVRRHGPVRLRFGLEELTDEVLDQFGNYLLGVDDAFARLLPPRGSAA